MKLIVYKPRDDKSRIEKFITYISIYIEVRCISFIYIQQQTTSKFEKDMSHLPSSPPPRFSRTFDMLLSRVR
jgi:hypothetical protein